MARQRGRPQPEPSRTNSEPDDRSVHLLESTATGALCLRGVLRSRGARKARSSLWIPRPLHAPVLGSLALVYYGFGGRLRPRLMKTTAAVRAMAAAIAPAKAKMPQGGKIDGLLEFWENPT